MSNVWSYLLQMLHWLTFTYTTQCKGAIRGKKKTKTKTHPTDEKLFILGWAGFPYQVQPQASKQTSKSTSKSQSQTSTQTPRQPAEVHNVNVWTLRGSAEIKLLLLQNQTFFCLQVQLNFIYNTYTFNHKSTHKHPLQQTEYTDNSFTSCFSFTFQKVWTKWVALMQQLHGDVQYPLRNALPAFTHTSVFVFSALPSTTMWTKQLSVAVQGQACLTVHTARGQDDR